MNVGRIEEKRETERKIGDVLEERKELRKEGEDSQNGRENQILMGSVQRNCMTNEIIIDVHFGHFTNGHVGYEKIGDVE